MLGQACNAGNTGSEVVCHAVWSWHEDFNNRQTRVLFMVLARRGASLRVDIPFLRTQALSRGGPTLVLPSRCGLKLFARLVGRSSEHGELRAGLSALRIAYEFRSARQSP